MDTLTSLAAQRGITLDILITDLLAADGMYRKVGGRTVVCREGGVPALADECNNLLRHRDENSIRDEILGMAELNASAYSTLADAIALIGKKKKAREVLAALLTYTSGA